MSEDANLPTSASHTPLHNSKNEDKLKHVEKESLKTILSENIDLSNLHLTLDPRFKIFNNQKRTTHSFSERDEIEVYRALLERIVSPLRMQVRDIDTTETYDSQKVTLDVQGIDEDSEEKYNFGSGYITGTESFHMQLIKTLNRILPMVKEKQRIWDSITSLRGYDPTIGELLRRQTTIGDHEYYTSDNFDTVELLTRWKAQEMDATESLLAAALGDRAIHRYCSVELHIKKVSAVKSFLSYELEFGSKKWKSKPGDRERMPNGTYLIPFDRQHPPVLESKVMTPGNDFPMLKITFHKDKMFGKEKVGELLLDMNTLIERNFEPKYSWWGVVPLTDVVEPLTMFKTSKVAEPSLLFDLTIRFQNYPAHEQNLQAEHARLNYHEMMELFMDRLVAATDMTDVLFNYHEKWLITEFSNVYGISEVFKQLMVIRALVGRVDLLIPFYRELSSALHFVESNLKHEYVITTKSELRLFNELLAELVKRLEVMIGNFVYHFPENKPANSLATLVALYGEIQRRFFDQTPEAVMQAEERLIVRAAKNAYKAVKEEQIELFELDEADDTTPACMAALCKSFRENMDTFLYYSRSFDPVIDVDAVMIEEFYGRLTKDVQHMLESQQDDAYDMLVLALELQKLQKSVLDQFSEDTIAIKFLSFKPIVDKYLPIFVENMGHTLTEWMLNAVSLDTWAVVSDKDLYSSSVVDFFTAAGKIRSFFVELDFVGSEAYDHIVRITCNAAIAYCLTLSRLASDDIRNNTRDMTPRDHYTLKINNLLHAKQQLREITHSLVSYKRSLPHQNENNTIETENFVNNALNEMEDITDETLALLVSLILPQIELSIKDIVRQAKMIKKVVVDDQTLPESLKIATEEILNELYKSLLDDMFATMKSRLYTTLFNKFLSEVYIGILLTMEYIVLNDPRKTSKDPNVSSKKPKPLTHTQVLMLKYALNLFDVYFEGAGEGLSSEFVLTQSKSLNSLLAMYITQNSTSLVRVFAVLYENPQNTEHNGIHLTAYSVYRLLETRSDSVAKKFVQSKHNDLPLIHLKSEFTLKKDERLVEYVEGYDSNYISCTMFATNHRILISKHMVMTHVGWTQINLTNITRITMIRHVYGTGFKFEYFENGGIVDERMKRLRFYTLKHGIRKKLMISMKALIRASGNTRVDEMATLERLGINDEFIKSDIDAQLELEDPTGEDSHRPLKLSTLSYYDTLRKQVKNTLEDEIRNTFEGIPNDEKIIDRFKCKYKHKSGYLYVLTNHCCFVPSNEKLNKVRDLAIDLATIHKLKMRGTRTIEIQLDHLDNKQQIILSQFLERDAAFACMNAQMRLKTAALPDSEASHVRHSTDFMLDNRDHIYKEVPARYKSELGNLLLTDFHVIWNSLTNRHDFLKLKLKDMIYAKPVFGGLRRGKLIKMKFSVPQKYKNEDLIRFKFFVKSHKDLSEVIHLANHQKLIAKAEES